MKRLFFILFFIIIGSANANAGPVFIAGKDYKVLPQNAALTGSIKPGFVDVKEFFSYGCPWCYKLENDLAKWHRKLPKHVLFSRVPVVFEPGWDVYAKAYYTSNLLGVSGKMSAALFDAIQVKEQKLSSNDVMIKFFIKMGVKEKIAKSAFLSSPTINAKVRDGISQMQLLQVNSVPCFVINNHYKVDIAMLDGNSEKLFLVIGFLVAKELAATLHEIS